MTVALCGWVWIWMFRVLKLCTNLQQALLPSPFACWKRAEAAWRSLKYPFLSWATLPDLMKLFCSTFRPCSLSCKTYRNYFFCQKCDMPVCVKYTWSLTDSCYHLLWLKIISKIRWMGMSLIPWACRKFWQPCWADNKGCNLGQSTILGRNALSEENRRLLKAQHSDKLLNSLPQ